MIAALMATRLGRWLAAAGAVIVAALGIYLAGRKSGADGARAAQERANADNWIDTKRRADDALAASRADADSLPNGELIDRLRDRGAFRQ